jgi:calcineurin-like phosphoesterase family protein
MSKIWFSSDFHFGHQNIAGPKISSWNEGYRNFDSVSEMDQVILDGINKNVAPEDTLYFLGDFCFGGHVRTPLYRSRIACQTIHVCRGNHDEKLDLYKDSFTSVNDVMLVKHGKHNFWLSHYSHQVWIGSHKGYIHLFGHSHDSITGIGKSMDVGIDTAYGVLKEYRPFSIEEIISFMDRKEIVFLDHHKQSTNIR